MHSRFDPSRIHGNSRQPTFQLSVSQRSLLGPRYPISSSTQLLQANSFSFHFYNYAKRLITLNSEFQTERQFRLSNSEFQVRAQRSNFPLPESVAKPGFHCTLQFHAMRMFQFSQTFVNGTLTIRCCPTFATVTHTHVGRRASQRG
jgi:hypothetical protein